MKIKKISIKNFKGIKEQTFDNFEKINQIIGENGAGKTSLNEAVKFLFSGTGKDKGNITEGEKQAEVSAMIEVRGQDIEIIKNIDHLGKCSTNMCVNGTWHRETKTALIKDLFGLASFNPDQITSPKERVKVFSELIKKEFIYPDEVKEFEKDDVMMVIPRQKDLIGENAILCLQKIQKGLEQHRLLLGREKNSAENVFKKHEEELKKINMEILEEGIEKDDIPKTSELLEKKAELDIYISDRDNIEKKLKDNKEAESDLKLKIKEIEIDLKNRQDLILKGEEKLKVLSNKSSENLINQISVAKKRDQSEIAQKEVDEYKKKCQDKTGEYQKVNKFLREEFIKLFAKYIDPLKKIVNGIDLVDGNWLYKGVSIDNLSRSETLDLALKLIEAQGRDSNVVCIDNAEMFDTETIKKLSLNTEGTSFLLMKVGKPFDIPSKVIEVKKQTKQETILI